MTTSSPEHSIRFVHTSSLPDLLRTKQFSLAVTTYQARKLFLVSPQEQNLTFLGRTFPRPTGVAYHDGQLALCTKNQLWLFQHAGSVHNEMGQELPYDLFLTPRRSYVTGDILSHDIGWSTEGPLLVNTRFSCLCMIDAKYSFVPVWMPPFITACVPEDRCHLNGLALEQGAPAYVTALSETDTREGWRAVKAKSGVVIDVAQNTVIARGLSMPHSPRIYGGKLYVLESGTGEFITIDRTTGAKHTIARLQGYLRGLHFIDSIACIATSKARETSNYGGLPIEPFRAQFTCGITFYDVSTSTVLGQIEFQRGIEELFDVLPLPGIQRPFIVGFEDSTVDGVFILR